MTDNLIIIPTPQALSRYSLSRFVGTKSYNGQENNPFIKVNEDNSTSQIANDYNDKNFYTNEVILQVIEYQPYKIKTKEVNGMVQASLEYGSGSAANAAPPIATFRLLLDDDKVKTQFKHEWKDPGASLLSSLYDKLNDVSSNVAMGTTLAANGAARLGVGGDSPYVTEPLRKTDFQKVYNNSSYPTVPIQFTAFTNDDFINDIYLPIMAIISYTHPKRFVGANSYIGTGDDWLSLLSKTSSILGDIVATANQKIIESVALTARQYTLKPPCLFNLYHQAGLYSHVNCMCVDISIEYEGPWYNTSAKEQQIFDVLKNGPIELNISRRAFPTIAKVSMTFETSNRLMRDDFTFMAKNFIDIDKVTPGSTTFTQFGNQG